MASFNKINIFVANIANGVHNLGSDQLKVFLTDSSPTASNTVIANITEVSYTNCSTRNITTTSSTQTSGTYKLLLTQLTLTASGTVGPFRYVGVYDSTAASGPLICWYDNGSEVTLNNGDTFLVAFDTTNGLLQIA